VSSKKKSGLERIRLDDDDDDDDDVVCGVWYRFVFKNF
jgi:hypothetical protein